LRLLYYYVFVVVFVSENCSVQPIIHKLLQNEGPLIHNSSCVIFLSFSQAQNKNKTTRQNGGNVV
jgi:hypothetical protein